MLGRYPPRDGRVQLEFQIERSLIWVQRPVGMSDAYGIQFANRILPECWSDIPAILRLVAESLAGSDARATELVPAELTLMAISIERDAPVEYHIEADVMGPGEQGMPEDPYQNLIALLPADLPERYEVTVEWTGAGQFRIV